MLRDLPIARTHLRPDARALDEAAVAGLMESIGVLGQMTPIRVRPLGLDWQVTAGGHRREAMKRLGRETIRAEVVDEDDDTAELAMIDENLRRAELSPAERARQTFRRQQLYEAVHGKAKAAGARAANEAMGRGDANDKLSFASFTADTAGAVGRDVRSVQRDAERGRTVIAEVLDMVRGTHLDTGTWLDQMKGLRPNDQVEATRRALAIGRQREAAKQPSVAEQLRALRQKDPRAFAAVVREEREIVQGEKKERRTEREAELGARQQALPQKRYGVILADPEWRFETYSRETGMDRAADNHYPTSPLEAIKARPVGDIAAEDCALLLWATVPMLPQALEVMAAWGFAYKSHSIWLKDAIGTGYWFRNQHELLLLGIRGNVPAPAMGSQFRSALAHPVGAHSEKPPFAHEIAETYFPSLPKIELNARAARPGWDVWGLEAPGAVSSGDGSAEPGHHQAKPRQEAPEPIDHDTHQRPSTSDESSPEAGPQAEASLCREQETGVPAGREGRPAGEVGPAGLPNQSAERMSRKAAEPILRARYADTPTVALAAELGVPVPTLRVWAFRMGLTSRDRLVARGREMWPAGGPDQHQGEM